MKRLLVLFISISAVLTAWGQQPPPGKTATPQKKPVSPFADYAGEWTSKLDGKIWLRLTLHLDGEKLSGSLVHARDISLNDNGELKSVSEEHSAQTITEAVVNPDGLLITSKDADTQETDRYLMKLLQPAKDAADLKVVGQAMPPGMPKPKPWRITKSGVSSATP